MFPDGSLRLLFILLLLLAGVIVQKPEPSKRRK